MIQVGLGSGLVVCVGLKGSYDVISSLPFSLECYKLFCIDKIPEVAKTKSQTQRDILLLKLRLCHALLKRLIQTRPYVYVTVWEDLHNTAQTYTQ